MLIVILSRIELFVINYLLSLKFTYSLKNFDFLSCRLDKDSNYQFVFSRLETTLNINTRASSDDLGNIANGGNWILESDNVNIQDIYFNDTLSTDATGNPVIVMLVVSAVAGHVTSKK